MRGSDEAPMNIDGKLTTAEFLTATGSDVATLLAELREARGHADACERTFAILREDRDVDLAREVERLRVQRQAVLNLCDRYASYGNSDPWINEVRAALGVQR